MHFTIRHHTHYRYSHPVRFSPQRLRFHPRDDGAQRLIDHQLNIAPTPLGRNEHLDLEGNRVTQIWFEAYVGGRWYTFDATQAKLKGGYVAVGYGRDAADVAIYNQFGPAVYPISQTVRVECIRG